MDRDEKGMSGRKRNFKELVCFLDSIEAHIFVLDCVGHIKCLNRVLLKTIGHSFLEVKDKYLWDVLLPPGNSEPVKEIFEELRQFLETESTDSAHLPFTRESCMVTKAGSERVFDWSINALWDDAGNLEYVIGTGRDITQYRQTEEELSDSITRQRAVFEGTTIGIVVADTRGKIIQANPALQRMLLYTEQELTRMVFADFTYPDDLRVNLNLFYSLIAGEIDHYQMDKRYVRRDGSVFWADLNISATRNQEGGILYVIGILEDITERKKAEETKLRLNAIIEETSDFVATADLNGKILDYNKAARKWLGIEENDDLVNCRISDTQPSDRVPIVWDEGIPQAIEHGIWSGESLILTPDGKEIPVSQVIIAHKTVDGSLAYLSTIVRDITEHLLARQVSDLTRSNEELEQFAYITSHDLQEPLRMISSYTQLLASRYQGRLDADAEEFINYIVDGTKRMQRLIRDLLAYSRVTTQGQKFEEVDVNTVFGQVLTDLDFRIRETQAIITYDSLPMVKADATQLGQLFLNILGNALKYHGEATPEIHVGVEHQGLEWVFSIRDNGIGIAPEHYERIFMIFQRLHARNEYSGTGIGLAICKKIVERRGGRIWVSSTLNEGSTFFFTIPE